MKKRNQGCYNCGSDKIVEEGTRCYLCDGINRQWIPERGKLMKTELLCKTCSYNALDICKEDEIEFCKERDASDDEMFESDQEYINRIYGFRVEG